MANAAAIEAGKAFVRLFLKDDMTAVLSRSLKSAGEELTKFGAGTMKAGAGILAAGGAALAPIAAGVAAFTEMGSAANDAAARTGLSVEAISELGFAARQAGADMDAVEVGIKKMSVAIANLDDKAFAEIGIAVEELQVLSPEQQFEKVAAAISAVQDPAKKTAAAVGIFGKAGTGLIPMLGDLEALRKKARELGIVMSTEDATAADDLGDLFDQLKDQTKAVGFQIGAAVAGPLKTFAKVATEIVGPTIQWVKDNKALVAGFAAAGVAIAATGAAVIALGASIAALGAILSAAGTVIGGSLAAVLSPIGLISAAVAIGAAAWLKFSGAGKAAIDAIKTVIGPAAATIRKTIDGVTAALSSGDWSLAGKIAGDGFRLALVDAIDALADLLPDSLQPVRDALGTVGDMIAEGDWAGLVEIATATMSDAWEIGLNTVKANWEQWLTDLRTKFFDVFSSMWSWWSEQIQEMTSRLGEWIGLFDNADKQQQKRDADRKTQIAELKQSIAGGENAMIDIINNPQDHQVTREQQGKWLDEQREKLRLLEAEDALRKGNAGREYIGNPMAQVTGGAAVDQAARNEAQRIVDERKAALLARIGSGGMSVEDRAEREYLRKQDRDARRAKLKADALIPQTNAYADDFAKAMGELAKPIAPVAAGAAVAAAALPESKIALGATFNAAAAEAGGQLGSSPAQDRAIKEAIVQQRLTLDLKKAVESGNDVMRQTVAAYDRFFASLKHR